MWWKIGVLTLATAALIFSIIPMRTHAVLFDPANPPPNPTLWTMVSSMYLTWGTLALIIVIVGAAAAIGIWIVRSA